MQSNKEELARFYNDYSQKNKLMKQSNIKNIVYIIALQIGVFLTYTIVLILLLYVFNNRFNNIFAIADCLSHISASILALITVYKWKWQEFIVLKRVKFKNMIIYLFLAVIFAISYKILTAGTLKFHINVSVGSWLMISVLIIAPVIEEIVFRGLPFEYLSKKGVNKWYTISISTLLFGLMHLPFYSFFDIQFFILGFLLMMIYMKERNLIYCMLTHFTSNAIMLFTAG